MAYAQGLESGSRLARGMIDTYRETNQTAREREAARRIALLDEEMTAAQQPQTPMSGLADGQVAQPFATAPVQRGITRAPMEGSSPAAAARTGLTPTPTPTPLLRPAAGVMPEPVAQPRGRQTYQQATQGLTPARPTQSEMLRRQSEIYAQVGLAPQAQELNQQAMLAERDETRAATEQQRFDLGLQREDAQIAKRDALAQSAEKRAQSGETRAQSTFDFEVKQRGATQTFMAAAMANPDADIATLFDDASPDMDFAAAYQFLSARGTLKQQQEAQTQIANLKTFRDGIAARIGAGEELTTDQIFKAASESEADFNAALETVTDIFAIDRESAARDAEKALFDLNKAMAGGVTGIQEYVGKTTVDPIAGDDIKPEFREVAPNTGVYAIMYGNEQMPGTQTFEDADGITAWEDFAGKTRSILEGSPLAYAMAKKQLAAAGMPDKPTMTNFVSVYNSLANRDIPIMSARLDANGREMRATPQELAAMAKQIVAELAGQPVDAGVGMPTIEGFRGSAPAPATATPSDNSGRLNGSLAVPIRPALGLTPTTPIPTGTGAFYNPSISDVTASILSSADARDRAARDRAAGNLAAL